MQKDAREFISRTILTCNALRIFELKRTLTKVEYFFLVNTSALSKPFNTGIDDPKRSPGLSKGWPRPLSGGDHCSNKWSKSSDLDATMLILRSKWTLGLTNPVLGPSRGVLFHAASTFVVVRMQIQKSFANSFKVVWLQTFFMSVLRSWSHVNDDSTSRISWIQEISSFFTS